MIRTQERATRAGERGFTMVEILVSIALGAVALAGFTAFNRFQLFALRNQATQIDLQLTARTIVDLMAREIRRAGLDSTCAKNFEAVRRASTSQIRVQSDLNSSGGIGSGDENIRYRYNSSNRSIERITSAGTEVLLDDVDANNLTFTYYDSNGNILNPTSFGDEDDITTVSGFLSSTQRALVRRVRIRLALDDDAVDPLNEQALEAEVSTQVDLRNRYFLGSTACS